MASSGPNSPATLADDVTVGTLAWANPGNAASSNNTYAQAANGSGTVTTHYLKATNFAFSIPSGAAIDGIVVEVERSNSTDNVGTSKDSAVRIVKGGSIGATNNGDTVNNWPDTDTYKTYGSSSNLWGETWAYSDINSTNFGVVLSASVADGGPASTRANVDHIRITVYYSTDLTTSASDSISITENVNATLVSNVSPSDSLTLTESTTLTLESNISKSEAISISESVTARLESNINKTESISLTENTQLSIGITPQVQDTVSVGELVSIQFTELFINITDGISITDVITNSLPFGFSVTENITTADIFGRRQDSFISKSEDLTLSENSILGLPITPRVSEAITLVEAILAAVSASQISLTVAVALTEYILIQVVTQLSVSEQLALSESLGLDIQIYPTGQDSISLTDQVAISMPGSLSPANSDLVALTESTSVLAYATNLDVSTSDNISLSDNVALSVRGVVDSASTIIQIIMLDIDPS